MTIGRIWKGQEARDAHEREHNEWWEFAERTWRWGDLETRDVFSGPLSSRS